MSTIPLIQQDLDVEIAHLERDIRVIGLERQQKSASPISNLPPELLNRIFYFCMSFLEAGGCNRSKILPEDTRASILSVSHHWRAITLISPDLWADIHIRDTTKLQYLDICLENAKNAPLYIEAYLINHLDGSKGRGVQHTLQAAAQRVKEVTLYTSIEVMRHLFPNIKAYLHTIEVLEMGTFVCGPHPERRVRESLTRLEQCQGQLRHLRVDGLDTLAFVAWSNPSSLETLDISFRSIPVTRLSKDFFGFLRSVGPHLKSLNLVFLAPGFANVQRDNFLARMGSSPIKMPILKTLSLTSDIPGLLPALSSLICAPASSRSINIATRSSDPIRVADNPWQDISAALQEARLNFPSPKYLRIGEPSISNSILPDASSDFTTIPATECAPLSARNKPGETTVRVSIETPIADLPQSDFTAIPLGRFDRDRTCSDEIPIPLPKSDTWLFGALRSISLNYPLPVSFWHALAHLPSLYAIEHSVIGIQDPFLWALEEGDELGGGRVPLELRGTAERFPSLGVLGIAFRDDSVNVNVMWGRACVVRAVADLLGKRQAKWGCPPLRSMRFAGRVADVRRETLSLLRTVANEVSWG
ncbi:hypothetical protein DFP72DRAFT_1173235 [Ephemerocybe angulata]|uniref:F-box domain-containing protein n=1 Tax=Ephemerocybe angulata TaxID=980116 RepID=A0A8H6HQF6_9AGAR|nr:hypothetical protein DFP72DRAFT_1173235 [Tulosesus angulatus]